MRQQYLDISRWGQPEKGGIFDHDYLGGLGQDTPGGAAEQSAPPAAVPAAPPAAAPSSGPVVLPTTTIYGQCDFISGGYLDAVQSYLVAQGDLSPAGRSSDGGTFGPATCAAWQKHFGDVPSPAALAALVLKPGETCSSLLVPNCGAASAASSLPLQIAAVGVGVIGAWLLYRAVTKR